MDTLLVSLSLVLAVISTLKIGDDCKRDNRYIDTVLEYRNGVLTEVHK